MEFGTDQATFFDVDAHAILSLPTRGAGDDSWAWELERHGHSMPELQQLVHSYNAHILQFARERGIRRICLETDCQVLVNLWVNRSHQNSEISPLIGQLEDLSRSFENFSLCFISRTCNNLAHACARLVSHNSQVVEWPITPPGLTDIINSDCKFVHD